MNMYTCTCTIRLKSYTCTLLLFTSTEYNITSNPIDVSDILRSWSCKPYLPTTSIHTGRQRGLSNGRKSVTINWRDEKPERTSESL